LKKRCVDEVMIPNPAKEKGRSFEVDNGAERDLLDQTTVINVKKSGRKGVESLKLATLNSEAWGVGGANDHQLPPLGKGIATMRGS